MRTCTPCDAKLSVVASTDIFDVSEIGTRNDRFQIEVARLKGQQSSKIDDEPNQIHCPP